MGKVSAWMSFCIADIFVHCSMCLGVVCDESRCYAEICVVDASGCCGLSVVDTGIVRNLW